MWRKKWQKSNIVYVIVMAESGKKIPSVHLKDQCKGKKNDLYLYCIENSWIFLITIYFLVVVFCSLNEKEVPTSTIPHEISHKFLQKHRNLC